MNKTEFIKWYLQAGRDMAEIVADFWGVPLRTVAAWEEEIVGGLLLHRAKDIGEQRGAYPVYNPRVDAARMIA